MRRNISSLENSVLIVNDEVHDETAAGRAIRALAAGLEAYNVLVAASGTDAMAIIRADASLHAAIIDWDLGRTGDHAAAMETLAELRRKNAAMPVFLLAERTRMAEIPVTVLQQADDFIWLLEDTVDFIAGRIIAAVKRYESELLPPMLRALVEFSEVHEYSWHTPGHTGGTAFLKSPAGRVFHNFFGENLLRSDLSISVGELGSLLDHSGPIGAGEAYAARVFGADRTYYVTNGTSTSNRVVVMACVTQDQIALCDRNCHKSIEHAMTFSGAIPVYLMPSRNHLGIIGPVRPELLRPGAIRSAIDANKLTRKAVSPDAALAILTNSTYDGLCYNIRNVEPELARSVDRILFDEAWFGYAKFHPLYAGRFGMHARPPGAKGATVFANQSTHKLLAALSQASMIHVRDGKRPIAHELFNEAFMMHASTSPQYAIIASNDVSAAMMDGPGGAALIGESIDEAIAFRQMLPRLQAEYKAADEWFFGVWQPTHIDAGATLFHQAPAERLASDPACWMLAPNAAWHGFGDLGPDHCMLDPIKVSITTPGADRESSFGIPAQVLSAYLDARGIVPEKTADFSVLFLFSLGITKGKWGTLINALLDFKRDYDANTKLQHVLPNLVAANPKRYATLGLKDLATEMFTRMLRLELGARLERGYATLPDPVCTPAEAYRQLVSGKVERVALSEMAGRIAATGIVPYPPGIPLVMPGEYLGAKDGHILSYLAGLESFDAEFPGFTHDIHGIESIGGRYHAMCLTGISRGG